MTKTKVAPFYLGHGVPVLAVQCHLTTTVNRRINSPSV